VETSPQNESFRFWTIYLVIIGAALFIGWKQPLRYRLLSKLEIDAIEHPVTPPPPSPTPRPRAVWEPPPPPAASPTPHWMWDPNRRNPLDNQPYNRAESFSRRYYYPTPYPRNY